MSGIDTRSMRVFLKGLGDGMYLSGLPMSVPLPEQVQNRSLRESATSLEHHHQPRFPRPGRDCALYHAFDPWQAPGPGYRWYARLHRWAGWPFVGLFLVMFVFMLARIESSWEEVVNRMIKLAEPRITADEGAQILNYLIQTHTPKVP